MKKIVRRIFVLLLVCLLFVSAVWYMFVYDRATVRDLLSDLARTCAVHNNYDGATWFYNLSYKISDKDQNVAIELADIYKDIGNYTKAEYTLANAIADGGNAELYRALCQTYVEQDKLLDAVNMLDKIADPAIKAELDAQRPPMPTADFDPGFYNQYISLTFSHEGGTLYVTTDGEYPSTSGTPVTEPIALSGGETKVYAVTVGEDGLVSPVAILNYTIGGVIEEVTLVDSAMESVIRAELLFGQDTQIFSDDLWTIREFTVPAEAAVLDDLAHLTQLRKLTISGHEIESFAFLSGMTHLEELVITDCSISDNLETIAALPMLHSLTISGTSLSTVADLEAAAGLTDLNLSSNAIGNITPLAGMKQLQKLDLSHNAITDITALGGMPQLTELSLAHNAITSMAPLGTCTALEAVDLSYNKLDSITAVDLLEKLTSLNLSYNVLASTGKLSDAASLQKLNLSSNVLTDVSGLSGLSQLTELYLAHNQLTAIPDFPNGMGLTIFNAEHNQITDISPLGCLPRLNYVYLDYNNDLTDISPLLDCPDLIQVNIYGAKIDSGVVRKLTDRSVIVNYNPTAE